MTFPSLIGGTLVQEDLVPSIIFCILFASLVPVAIFRLARKSSRTTLILGVLAFSVERVVIFALRAMQSRSPVKAGSQSLATYEQLTLGLGFISISQDFVSFLRVLLVRATQPHCQEGSTEKTLDRPRERKRYRRLADLLSLAFYIAIVPAFIAGYNYSNSLGSLSTATSVMDLRYASTGVTLLLNMTIGLLAWFASKKVEGVKRRPAVILMALIGLLCVVAIYRLAVMYHTTNSLLSRDPGSLSSPSAKSFFYIFHMLPEWLAASVLLGLNVRQVFDTGLCGDYKISDKESRWERKRRERKERKERKEGQKGCDDVIELVTTV